MKSTVLTLTLALALAASAACLWLAGARAGIALEGPQAAASFQAAGKLRVLASLDNLAALVVVDAAKGNQ